MDQETNTGLGFAAGILLGSGMAARQRDIASMADSLSRSLQRNSRPVARLSPPTIASRQPSSREIELQRQLDDANRNNALLETEVVSLRSSFKDAIFHYEALSSWADEIEAGLKKSNGEVG